MSDEKLGGEKVKGVPVEYKQSDGTLVKRINKLIALNPARWTQREIGAQVGSLTSHGPYTGGYVSTWLKGRWTGNEWEPAVAKFLEIVNEQNRVQREAEFLIDNSITTEVRARLDRSFKLGACVALTGDPGIGKTTALARFMSDKSGLVFRIQASPRRSRAVDIERTIVDIIGEEDDIFNTASNRSDCIVRYLLRFPRMLVIEDFDMLHRSAFEFLLRDLWNQLEDMQRGLPIVMFGNVEGIAKLRHLPRQISGRIQHIHLTVGSAFSTGFIRKFMVHHMEEIEVSQDMVKLGVKIANDPNLAHLRTLKQLCIEARDLVRDEEGDAGDTFADLCEENERTQALVDRRPFRGPLLPSPVTPHALPAKPELVEQ